MGVTDKLTNFIARKQQITRLRDKFSPNSWGRQQYEGTYYDTIHNEKIDLNNITAKKGWIVAYVKLHFEGIKRKLNKNQSDYTTRNISYRKTDTT